MIGIGTDILRISRIKAILEDSEASSLFLSNTYTDEEHKTIAEAAVPLYRYATHFAAKEAVFKTLGISSSTRFQWRDIEILYHETGQPYVLLHGTIEAIARGKEIACIMLSLSYDTEYAIAYATAL